MGAILSDAYQEMLVLLGSKSIPQKTANSLYKLLIELEIRHSKNYLKLYQTERAACHEESAMQAKSYLFDSIAFLANTRGRFNMSDRITLDLDNIIDKHISEIRAAF